MQTSVTGPTGASLCVAQSPGGLCDTRPGGTDYAGLAVLTGLHWRLDRCLAVWNEQIRAAWPAGSRTAQFVVSPRPARDEQVRDLTRQQHHLRGRTYDPGASIMDVRPRQHERPEIRGGGAVHQVVFANRGIYVSREVRSRGIWEGRLGVYYGLYWCSYRRDKTLLHTGVLPIEQRAGLFCSYPSSIWLNQ
jgi:hypothetical protein